MASSSSADSSANVPDWLCARDHDGVGTSSGTTVCVPCRCGTAYATLRPRGIRAR